MTPSFSVSIQSRDGSIYEGSAVSLVAPGEMGYLGILHNHAPIVTTLVRGKLTVRTPDEKTILIRSDADGFMDVLKDHVSIVLESAEVVK